MSLVGEETYDLRTETHSSLFKSYPTFTPPDAALCKNEFGPTFRRLSQDGKDKVHKPFVLQPGEFTFMDKYLFSFNVRADGSSKAFALANSGAISLPDHLPGGSRMRSLWKMYHSSTI